MAARSPEGVHAALEDALNHGDLDAFVATFEENATAVAPPDRKIVHGRREIRTANAPIFALKPSVRIDVVGKVQGDGLALTHARWTLHGTDSEGNPVELDGRGTIVSRRQADGGWLIVLENSLSPG
jgi:uncharacterized protein (TIGR02246 family)